MSTTVRTLLIGGLAALATAAPPALAGGGFSVGFSYRGGGYCDSYAHSGGYVYSAWSPTPYRFCDPDIVVFRRSPVTVGRCAPVTVYRDCGPRVRTYARRSCAPRFYGAIDYARSCPPRVVHRDACGIRAGGHFYRGDHGLRPSRHHRSCAPPRHGHRRHHR